MQKWCLHNGSFRLDLQKEFTWAMIFGSQDISFTGISYQPKKYVSIFLFYHLNIFFFVSTYISLLLLFWMPSVTNSRIYWSYKIITLYFSELLKTLELLFLWIQNPFLEIGMELELTQIFPQRKWENWTREWKP